MAPSNESISFREKGGSIQKMRYLLSESPRRKLHVQRRTIAKGIDFARPWKKARVFSPTPFLDGCQSRKGILKSSLCEIDSVCASARPEAQSAIIGRFRPTESEGF